MEFKPAVNVDPIEQVTNAIIGHAAAIVAAQSEKEGTTPRHWVSALWRERMLVAPDHRCPDDQLAEMIRQSERERIAEELPRLAGWHENEMDTIRLAQKRIKDMK